MNPIQNIQGVLHRIRCKLYPNYLPRGGTYLARTDNEASLTIEQVCDRMTDRGYTGDRGLLVNHVKLFQDAVAYELCDGFAVNNGYFTVYPKVGGTFDSVKEAYNKEKNPLTFRFRPGVKLRRLSDYIEIDIDGVAESSSYIDTFRDQEEDLVNSVFVPGHVFSVSGCKIKIAGDHPDIGIYFVPIDNPSEAVKVTRIVGNYASKVLGIVPDVVSWKNRIEIRTQFSGSTKVLLKAPRIITSDFTVELG